MFINTPNNYSTLWGPLIYEYSATEVGDLEIEIQDATLGEAIAVKKFYSSSTAKVNISPIIFEAMAPTVGRGSGGFVTPSEGFPKISVIVGDESTQTLTFSYAKGTIEPPMLLTTLPLQRILRPTEQDRITLLSRSDSMIKAILTAEPREEGGSPLSQTIYSGGAEGEGGARHFVVDGASYCTDYSTLSVELYDNSTLLGRYDYALTLEEGSGYRVAWLSSAGSIEHYTFPIIEEECFLSDGSRRVSLRSAYGTAQEVEALSEIISSRSVWHASAEGYTPLEVETTELTLRREGALMIANIKLSENG